MRIKEILNERVLNLFQPDDRLKYADEVWAMLQLSYKKAGGFLSADDIPDLIRKTNLWKLVRRHGKTTACSLYRDLHGRKTIASGTDGTPQGKSDYNMIKYDDARLERAWAEVSGAPERIMQKAGMRPLPAKFAGLLTGKEILEVNDDGFHYTRNISGELHEKIIYGTLHLNPEAIQMLTGAGIDVKRLPPQFKIS